MRICIAVMSTWKVLAIVLTVWCLTLPCIGFEHHAFPWFAWNYVPRIALKSPKWWKYYGPRKSPYLIICDIEEVISLMYVVSQWKIWKKESKGLRWMRYLVLSLVVFDPRLTASQSCLLNSLWSSTLQSTNSIGRPSQAVVLSSHDVLGLPVLHCPITLSYCPFDVHLHTGCSLPCHLSKVV